jgi:hypothetical protein
MSRRLIDAEKLKKHYAWWDDDERRTLFDQIVDAQPTIDAIPIEWLIRMRNKHNNDGFAWIYEAVMDDWREEHEETD